MAFEHLKDQKSVKISGFVDEVRMIGNLAFLILRRRDGTLQLIFKKKEHPELFEELNNTTMESFVEAEGKVALNQQARNGFEISVEKYKVITKSEPLPIDISGKIESEMNTRFNNRFLDLRQRKNMNYFVLRSKVIGYVNEYFQKEGFIAVNTPKITTIGAESGADLFKVDYFGRPAYLAQSPQVYKQMLQASGFEKIYEIGAVFRAEKSRTVRHLTEFTGLDAELSYVEKLSDVTDVIEGMLKYIAKSLEEKDKTFLEEMKISFNVPKKFPVITFYDALALLKEKYNHVINDDDLDPEGEKLLGKHFLEKDKSDFVIVINYPKTRRPFYHMYNDDNKTTNSFDLLYKGQELTTGAVREHRLALFIAQAEAKGLDVKQMKEYVDLLRYGVPPHGGFGIGLDRMIQKMADVENVKDVVLFPRDPDRLSP